VSQQRRRGTGWPRLTRLHAVLGGLAVLCVLAVAGGWAIAGHGSNASLSSSSAARGTPRPTLTETGDSPLATSATPQPTPLATPTPENCTAAPHLCGYPDATNTGVPAGMRLRQVPAQVSRGTGWYYDPRGWIEVDGKGAVLQGLSVTHTIDVSASDVTIKDVQVTQAGNNFGIDLRHTHNVTIENSDISSPYADSRRLMVGVKDVYGDSTGTKILANNIWHTATGVQIGEGLVKDNYIHSIGYRAGDHVNGVTVNGGTVPLDIRHNTVFVDLGQTDAISLFEDFGVEANKVIADNLVAGGGYSIYGGQNSGGPAAYNIRIVGNRISRLYYRHGGQFGPLAAFNSRGRGNVWSGNIWDGSEARVGG
jgi:hypothetical protein